MYFSAVLCMKGGAHTEPFLGCICVCGVGGGGIAPVLEGQFWDSMKNRVVVDRHLLFARQIRLFN